MPGTPNEYYVRYRLTDKDNTGTSGQTPWCAKSRFKLTGNTDITIGKITRIVVYHYHTSTKSPTWNLVSEIKFGDGSVITSNTVSHKFSADVYKYTNTFSSNLPTPEKWATWASYRSRATNSPSGQLYYRATSKYPLDIYVYFYDARDLVDGAAPPTVSGISYADNNGYLGSFGNYVQSRSNALITGQYRLDPNYIYLSAKHTLQLLNSAGVTLYTATQTDDSAFNVGAIDSAGPITWRYTVLDTAGNSVTRTGTFNVLPYAPPSISGYTAERYATGVDDMGNPTYTAADDGENVRFSFNASVAQVAGRNAWTMRLTYGTEGTAEDAGATVTLRSGSDGTTMAYELDRALLAVAISTSSAWWFKLTIADVFTSSSMMAYVDEAGAYFNVEEDGVSVGMRSNGSVADNRFEVAESYESHFFGGIAGVTNYKLGEVPTGGRWIDGRPIYRFLWSGQTALDGAQGAVCTLPVDPDAMIELRAMVLSGNGWRPVPNTYYGNINWSCNIYNDGATVYLGFGSSWSGTRRVVVFALYTKTTDAVRTIWVYSDKNGDVVLAAQSDDLFAFAVSGSDVVVSKMADLMDSVDGSGNVVIQ